jgi:hypothetical protein
MITVNNKRHGNVIFTACKQEKQQIFKVFLLVCRGEMLQLFTFMTISTRQTIIYISLYFKNSREVLLVKILNGLNQNFHQLP